MHRNVQQQPVVAVLLLLILFLAGCGGSEPYLETFDDPGTWRVASDSNVSGKIENGVYDFKVFADQLSFWTTAGESFRDGIYEVEAKQIDGPDDNAFGMIFRVSNDGKDFYTFQISGDGYVWIGRFQNGVEDSEPLVGSWWIESRAVRRGANETNKLTVQAEGGNMIFFVNDQEVGRVTDNSFSSGDIGLIVGTLGMGGAHVQFDNFAVRPLQP